MAVFFPFIELLSVIATAVVLGIGVHQVHHQAITAGTLIAFLLYIELFFSPIQQLSQVFDSYQQTVVGVDRISALLRTPIDTPDAVEPLARFYDPTAGSVKVDGFDIRTYELEDYRKRLGVVPQEPYLFGDTVRDAVAYGKPTATPAEIEWAARAVGAHEMIAALDHGYYQSIGDRGRNLSAGQRQLVALARAQLVEPDILILDEATASLDLATEARVRAAIDTLTSGRTTIVVAHRLATARDADLVLVVGDGGIKQAGTHDELVAVEGAYRELWAAYVGRPTVPVKELDRTR